MMLICPVATPLEAVPQAADRRAHQEAPPALAVPEARPKTICSNGQTIISPGWLQLKTVDKSRIITRLL
jgi:hypothetical protein